MFCAAAAFAEVKSEPWGSGGTKYTTEVKDKSGTKTHDVMKDKNGVKKEETMTAKDKATGTTTTTKTTYTKDEHGLLHPDITTTETKDAAGNILSKEKQVWDQNGTQQGGSYQPGGKGPEYKYDPGKNTYKDPNATPPANGGKPPKYPEIGEKPEKPDKPKKPRSRRSLTSPKNRRSRKAANRRENQNRRVRARRRLRRMYSNCRLAAGTRVGRSPQIN
jgi:hypothetical protein